MIIDTRLTAILFASVALAAPAWAQEEDRAAGDATQVGARDVDDAGDVDDVDDADDGKVEEIIVVGTKQSRYIVDGGDPTSGLDLDFLENPRNITFIPEQIVLDRKITDLEEALRNVPGVSQSDGFGGTNDDFFVRGFRRNVVYRNGFRRQTNFKANLTNVEYTQVIRGPASITYGQVEPGGLVDIVTKKPLEDQRIAGELRYGSFDDLLALFDWSQPLGDRVGLRVVASTQDAESFRDLTDISRDTVAISGRFDLTGSTTLDLAYEFRDESRPLDRGTISIPTADGRRIINTVVDIPISRRFGEAFEVFESEFSFYEATVSHDFGDRWSVRVGAAYEDSKANDLQARPRQAIVLDADAPITEDGFVLGPIPLDGIFDDPTDQVFLARRTDGSRNRNTEVLYLDTIVTGEFELFGINNRLAVGADYRDSEQTRQFIRGASSDGMTVPLLNLRNPTFGTLSGDFSLDGVAVDTFTAEDFGVFINNYVELTDRLGLLVGARYSDVEGESLGNVVRADGFTPQVGLSYRVTEYASLFASYAESFEPNRVFDDFSGALLEFDPETGKQYEFGAKAEFFGGRLQSSIALYRIDKVNVLGTDDIGNPILQDGQRSQGVELSVTGQPIPGMNVIAVYAFTDAQDSNGNRPRGVAENTVNLWMSYEWQDGALEGLGTGAGVFHQGNRFGDNGNSFTLGSYTLVDASVWYTLPAPGRISDDGTIRLQVAVKNIFDEEYFPAVGNNLRISLGTPRTVFGSVSFDF